MNDTETKAKLENEEDFINLKRFEYSLQQLMERYPEGCPDKIIAKALMIPEEEVEKLYQEIAQKLHELIEPNKQ